ncbi:MAG: hypothetical protein M3463_05335 [Verrucomicrobiota bacterium]|nr:hypothetical protein [Verrucomicrobiota bacterium]
MAGPSNTHNLQAMLRFLSKAGNDPRFNADTIMSEIAQVYDDSYGNGGLSWLDRMIYRYVLVPATRNGLREQERLFAWMNREGKPDWGPGRDDPMNLTKYFMTQLPEDTTVSQTDFPSVWNLGVRSGKRNGNQLLLNWSGDTPAVRSVIIDSALGLGAPPEHWALERMAELDTYLSQMKPPPWPKEFPAPKPELVAAGKPIYDAQCARCHEPGAEYTNLVIKIEEVGTDIERMKTWNKQAAEEANRRVQQMGINRPPMVELDPYGYVSPPLDGLWLRAPYLHNGSVPNLRELLEPVEKRSKIFYFGYDVYDPVNVGFVTSGPTAERVGFKHDTSLRGESNIGHLYGTDLPPEQKEALLEYMKTL